MSGMGTPGASGAFKTLIEKKVLIHRSIIVLLGDARSVKQQNPSLFIVALSSFDGCYCAVLCVWNSLCVYVECVGSSQISILVLLIFVGICCCLSLSRIILSIDEDIDANQKCMNNIPVNFARRGNGACIQPQAATATADVFGGPHMQIQGERTSHVVCLSGKAGQIIGLTAGNLHTGNAILLRY